MRAMIEFNHINWIFFTGEQGSEEIVGRYMKMLGLDRNDPRDIEMYKAKTSHIFLDDSDVAVQDYPLAIKSLESRENVKIRGIAVDYLQNLTVKDRNNPDMIIMDETKKIVEAARVIKRDARTGKYCIFMISQIKLLLSEDGNTPLKKSDTKGSAAIINMSDVMVGFHRDHKARAALVDDVVTLNLSKNRHGVDGVTLSYKWKPNRLLISGEKYEGVVSVMERKAYGK